MTYDWSNYSPSFMSELFQAESAKQEVRGILTRTIGRQIELVRESYHIGNVPDGFTIQRNQTGGKKKSILTLDPDRAHYWIKAFEMRASGVYSDQEIVDTVNAMGFKTKRRNKWSAEGEIIGKVGDSSLTIKELQHAIIKPSYCGIICHKFTKGIAIKSKSESMVTIEIFNKANRGKKYIKCLANDTYEIILNNEPESKIKRRTRDNMLFPFKFILCPICHKPFLASSPTGKSGQSFPTYHCARNHKYFGESKKNFEANIFNFISQFQANNPFNQTIKKKILDIYYSRQKELVESSCLINNNLAELKAEKATLIDSIMKTQNSLVIKELEIRFNLVQEQIDTATQKSSETDYTEEQVMIFIKRVSFLMEHLGEMINISQETRKQQAIWGLLFNEVPDYSQIISGTPISSLILEKIEAKNEAKITMHGMREFRPRWPPELRPSRLSLVSANTPPACPRALAYSLRLPTQLMARF